MVVISTPQSASSYFFLRAYPPSSGKAPVRLCPVLHCPALSCTLHLHLSCPVLAGAPDGVVVVVVMVVESHTMMIVDSSSHPMPGGVVLVLAWMAVSPMIHTD